jgi:hypothetical protein
MEDFDINGADVHDESNGNKYYKLPKKTQLYRGSDTESSHIVQPNRPSFFGFTLEAVEQYGAYAHTYSITAELKLLAIMEMDTSSNFYKEAPENIKKILDTNFGYITKDLRYSPADYSNQTDKKVMKYLCGKYQIYHGYAMNGLKTKNTGITGGSETFPAELAVCGDSLNKVVDEAPSTENGTPGKPRTGKPTGNAPRGDVKPLNHMGDSPNNTGDSPNNTDGSSNKNKFVGNLGFGDDSDSDSDQEGHVIPGILDFRDGGRIRFKKKGKQTKRKGKRTKKVVIKYKKTRSKRKRGGGKKKKKKTVSFKSCK